MWSNKIIIKTTKQIEIIRDSGKYLTELLYLVRDFVKPWVVSKDIERFAEEYINKNKVKWAFKWYQWFPANLCISVNDCLVHGEPSNYIMQDQDLLKIDAGINYKWWISDAAFTMIVGWDNKKSANKTNLVKTCKLALDNWVTKIQIGNSLFDYSKIVHKTTIDNNLQVIKNLTGHWVWKLVHEAPRIYNYPVEDSRMITIKPGMVLALEPIIAVKSKKVVDIKKWKWDLVTEKGDLWSQWEYTVAITENGAEIIAGIK